MKYFFGELISKKWPDFLKVELVFFEMMSFLENKNNFIYIYIR